MRGIFLLALLAILPLPFAGHAGNIDYAVADNNRGFSSSSDDFVRDLSDYLTCTEFKTSTGCHHYLKGSGCAESGDNLECTPELMRRGYDTKLRYDQNTHTYSTDLATDRTRSVHFDAPAAFRTGTHICELKLTLGSDTRSTSSPCTKTMALDIPYRINPSSGRLEASGRMTMTIRTHTGEHVTQIEEPFYSQDILIVALGDSFTAGEGNPLTNANDAKRTPPLWIEPRCSRSTFSYPYIAATMLSMIEKKHAVTVVNYACSGATTFEGLLGPYVGQLTKAQVQKIYKKPIGQATLPPQIEQAKAFLAATPSRRPDHVLLSIGVNDLSVMDFLVALASNDNTEEERKRLDSQRNQCPTNNRQSSVRISFECLRTRLASVRKEIDALRPHNVFVLEYPNPLTRNSIDAKTGKTELCFSNAATAAEDKRLLQNYVACRAGALGSWYARIFTNWEDLTGEEIKFAQERFFTPLTEAIKGGLKVGQDGWAYLTTHGNLQRRGFCARPSHYHTFTASIKRNGAKPGGKCISTGTLHPNVYGQYFTAVRVMAEIRDRYFNNDEYKNYRLHSIDKEDFEADKRGLAWTIWNRRNARP